MKIRHFRRGFGLSQIMAMLLVVVPMIAFSVTIMLDYWSVMQTDYRLKLIANMTSEYANSLKDTTNFVDLTEFQTKASKLCPGGKTVIFSVPTYTGPAGEISITVEHTVNGGYFNGKRIATTIETYSYHDQNLSVTLTCP